MDSPLYNRIRNLFRRNTSVSLTDPNSDSRRFERGFLLLTVLRESEPCTLVTVSFVTKIGR